MFQSDLFHHFHCQLVLVGGNVGGGEYRCHFVLCRCNFVVLGGSEYADLPQRLVQVSHISCNTGLQICEVLVIQLLTLRRHCTEQGTAGHDQVFTLVVHLLVDEEVFLLRTNGRSDLGCGGVAEQAQDADSLLAQCVHGTQQRCFLIQCLTGIGNENSRNVQGAFFHKAVGSRIPCGIASCRAGLTQTAGRERRGIWFALDQLFAGKVHNYHAVVSRADERVVLFCGRTCHRLEPVGIVGRTVFDRPILNGICHNIGISGIQGSTHLTGFGHCLIDRLRESCLHDFIIEDVACKVLSNIFGHDNYLLKIKSIFMVHRLRTAYCKLHRFHHGNAFVSPIISERSEEMPVGIQRQHTRLNRCVFGFICCCLFFKSALLVTIRHSTGNSAELLCFFQLTLLSYSNF